MDETRKRTLTVGESTEGTIAIVFTKAGGPTGMLEVTDEEATALHHTLGALLCARERRQDNLLRAATRSTAMQLLEQGVEFFGEIRERARKADESFEAWMGKVREGVAAAPVGQAPARPARPSEGL